MVVECSLRHASVCSFVRLLEMVVQCSRRHVCVCGFMRLLEMVVECCGSRWSEIFRTSTAS